MRAAIVMAALLVVTRVVSAQPAPAPDPKDSNNATLLAVAGTVAPFALVAATLPSIDDHNVVEIAALTAGSFLLLPSAGHWYAGRFMTPGMITRAAGLTIASVGFAIMWESDTNGKTGKEILWAGAITTAAGAVVDIATAGQEADHYNDTHRTQVKPVAVKFTGGGYGIGLGGSF